MKRLITFSLIFCVLCISSCVRATQPTDSYKQKPKTKVSATQVVIKFLEAIRSEDFPQASEQVHTFYSDKEGYTNSLKYAWEASDIKLLQYKVLGNQVFKNTATIFAELQREQKSSDEVKKTTMTVKFDLSLFGKEWKIIKDSCIENCAVNNQPN